MSCAGGGGGEAQDRSWPRSGAVLQRAAGGGQWAARRTCSPFSSFEHPRKFTAATSKPASMKDLAWRIVRGAVEHDSRPCMSTTIPRVKSSCDSKKSMSTNPPSSVSHRSRRYGGVFGVANSAPASVLTFPSFAHHGHRYSSR